MGETAAREVRLAIPEDEVDLGLVTDCVDNIRVTERDKHVVVVVLVELGIFVWRHFDVVDANVFVFNFQMMMRFAWHITMSQRHGGRRLGEE